MCRSGIELHSTRTGSSRPGGDAARRGALFPAGPLFAPEVWVGFEPTTGVASPSAFPVPRLRPLGHQTVGKSRAIPCRYRGWSPLPPSLPAIVPISTPDTQEDTVAKKDEQPVLVRMPTDLHHALKTAARSEDRTMAQFIREAIRDRIAATSGPSTRRV